MNTISIIYMVAMSLIAVITFAQNIIYRTVIASYEKARRDDYMWLKNISIHSLDIIRREYIATEDFERARQCTQLIEDFNKPTKNAKNG